jgi:transcriptional regulator with XRE-family HTH domain/ribosomal protein L37AE/L43A
MTRLVSLEPIIGDSWNRERLWSYVSRIAEYHGVLVGDLIKDVIWPESGWPRANRRPLRGFVLFGHIDGDGSVARQWVDVLQKLTGRRDLARLTFLPAANIAHVEFAKKSGGARCIECVRESSTQPSGCFDQLVWSVNEYTACFQHHVSLSNSCVVCGSEDLALVRVASRIGCCGKCGVWMGGSAFRSEPLDEASRYALAISEATSDLVRMLDDPRLKKVNSPLLIEYLAKNIFNGNYSEMARRLNLDVGTLSKMVNNRSIPRLGILLALCLVSGVELRGLLLGSLTSLHRCSLIPSEPFRNVDARRDGSRRKLNKGLAARTLRNALRVRKAISLDEVARRVATSCPTLRRHFPDLCKKVTTRYRKYLNARSEAAYAQFYEGMQRKLEICERSGDRPTFDGLTEDKGCNRAPRRLAAIRAALAASKLI